MILVNVKNILLEYNGNIGRIVGVYSVQWFWENIFLRIC